MGSQARALTTFGHSKYEPIWLTESFYGGMYVVRKVWGDT